MAAGSIRIDQGDPDLVVGVRRERRGSDDAVRLCGRFDERHRPPVDADGADDHDIVHLGAGEFAGSWGVVRTPLGFNRQHHLAGPARCALSWIAATQGLPVHRVGTRNGGARDLHEDEGPRPPAVLRRGRRGDQRRAEHRQQGQSRERPTRISKLWHRPSLWRNRPQRIARDRIVVVDICGYLMVARNFRAGGILPSARRSSSEVPCTERSRRCRAAASVRLPALVVDDAAPSRAEVAAGPGSSGRVRRGGSAAARLCSAGGRQAADGGGWCTALPLSDRTPRLGEPRDCVPLVGVDPLGPRMALGVGGRHVGDTRLMGGCESRWVCGGSGVPGGVVEVVGEAFERGGECLRGLGVAEAQMSLP